MTRRGSSLSQDRDLKGVKFESKHVNENMDLNSSLRKTRVSMVLSTTTLLYTQSKPTSASEASFGNEEIKLAGILDVTSFSCQS